MDGPTIEEQLTDAFDNLTAKSAKNRLIAFETIRKALSEKIMLDYITNRKITVLDSLSRCIKRSKGQDLANTASLISIVCSIIGSNPETDPLFGEIVSQLVVLLGDLTIQADVRSSCAQAVAICSFIMGAESFYEQVMDRLFAIFCDSCAKGDGTMPNPPEKLALLHSVSLQAWSLLLTAVNNSSPRAALELIDGYMDKVIELLDSPHLDLRVSAGESLAIMCEIIKSKNDDATPQDFEELCDKLRELINETQKYRGKKDLRQQRANFREILAAVEEDEAPNNIIKFGRERLALASWSTRRQYDAFCELFGAGINQQLAENEVLRDIFGLGDVVVHMDLPQVKRSEIAYENSIADKARTKNMRRLRDKRADVII